MTTRKSTFAIDGISLAVRVDGTPGGPPVVLLHGVTSSSRSYDDVVAALDPRLEIHRLDFRGHGLSSRSPGAYAVPSFAGDVAAYLEQVVGRKAFVAGHSLGGVVTHTLAQTRPDLLIAAFEEDPPLFFCDQSLFDASPYATLFPMLEAGMRQMQAAGLSEPQVIEVLRDAPTGHGVPASAVMTESQLAARAFEQLHADADLWIPTIRGGLLSGYDPLAPVQVATTILCADPAMAPAISPEQAAQVASTSALVSIIEVAGATHLIHIETPTFDVYVQHLVDAIDSAFA